jgi:DNA-binding transcriptional LysR family regulator
MVLDLESVRLFVLAAEFGNLTRAAEAAGTVQPVVS